MALTQVKSDGIATGAVTADQIATGAVTANDLADSGVTAGTYGSSSAIPAITVDAKGRITSASTNSVSQVGGASGVDFNDRVKARFGTGNDLEIYHDGTVSYIDNNTGNLYIRNNVDNDDGGNIYIQSKSGEDGIVLFDDADVRLYYDNSQKLATTSSGVTVTGDLQIEDTSPVITLKDTDSTGNAQIHYIRGIDSSNSERWWMGAGSGSNQNVWLANSANADVIFKTNGIDRARVDASGHFKPNANNTYDLGTSSNRWRNVYTNDLNLSNEGGTNDVDNTWGSWTIQEGEDDLFLLNRRNGKKYKFNLTEVS